jgi:hypothetical protein
VRVPFLSSSFLEGAGFCEEVRGMKMKLVLATVEVYQSICSHMLPTPTRLVGVCPLHFNDLNEPNELIEPS